MSILFAIFYVFAAHGVAIQNIPNKNLVSSLQLTDLVLHDLCDLLEVLSLLHRDLSKG